MMATNNSIDNTRHAIFRSSMLSRIMVGSLPLVIVLMLLAPANVAGHQPIDLNQRQVVESSGIEVTLRLPGDQTLGRALELTRVLRETGDVDRISYKVSDDENEHAEVTHQKDASPESISRVVEKLAELMVHEVIVTLQKSDSQNRLLH